MRHPFHLKNWILNREKVPGSSQEKSPYLAILWTVCGFVLLALGQSGLLFPYFDLLAFFSGAFGLALLWKGLWLLPPRKQLPAAFFLFMSIWGIWISWMSAITLTGPLFLLLWLFVASACSIQMTLLTAIAFQLKRQERSNIYLVCALAAFGTIMELLRLEFMSGFSWNPWGMLWSHNLPLLQLSSILGIFGLSFALFFLNGCAFLTRPKVYCATLIGLFSLGSVLMLSNEYNKTPLGNFNILLVQPGQMASFNEHPFFRLENLEKLMLPYAKDSIDLILMPENAIAFEAHERFPIKWQDQIIWQSTFEGLQNLARRWHADVVVGLEERDNLPQTYQSALFIPHDRKEHYSYAKQILVPIGEYIPYAWCRSLAERFDIYDSFAPGQSPVLFYSSHAFAPSICYEETFGRTMCLFRQLGAQCFLNLTNDGWYPHSTLPYQHFLHARVRAAENGIPLLRSCTTGISGVIDHQGRILYLTSIDQTIAHRETVHLINHPTLYPHLGDWGIICCSTLCLLVAIFKRKTYK